MVGKEMERSPVTIGEKIWNKCKEGVALGIETGTTGDCGNLVQGSANRRRSMPTVTYGMREASNISIGKRPSAG